MRLSASFAYAFDRMWVLDDKIIADTCVIVIVPDSKRHTKGKFFMLSAAG